jgi:ABC-type multidrug transport system fused ATPase/permease subunit
MGTAEDSQARDTEKRPAKPTRWQRTRAVLPYLASLLWPKRFVLAAAVGLLFLSRALGMVVPASIQLIVDQVVGQKRTNLLFWIAIVILAATLAQGATGWLTSRILTNMAQQLIRDLRREVHSHALRLPAVFFASKCTGTLVSRIMHDVASVESVCGSGLVAVMGALLTGAIAFAVLLLQDALLTFESAGLLALFAATLLVVFSKSKKPYREYAETYGHVAARLTEALGGIRVIKSFRAEDRERARFAEGSERLMNALRRGNDISSGMGLAGSAFLGGATAMVAYLGSRRVLSGAMTLGEMLAFVAFLGLFVGAVLQVISYGPDVARAIVGLERIREILDEAAEGANEQRERRLGRITGAIEVEKVGFEYRRDGEAVQALGDISFRAERGTVTALVGRSGAGKSTLAALLASLCTPTKGRILVDGVDLSTVTLDSYRAQVGLVLQDTFLFDATIRENVALASPEASEQAVVDACRAAQVDDFAEALPSRYETRVGERGIALSAGQRQRIAVARALLADPAILVLDEPTSNLDPESEARVEAAIARLAAGRTTFVVAHRLSTVRRASQILVLEAGKIVERGTHDDLIRAGGRYCDLWRRESGHP